MNSPAVCPRPMQPPVKPDLKVSRDIAAPVQKELGDSVLLGLDDERVSTLKGYYIEGWEIPGFRPSASLGEGWQKVEQDYNPKTIEFMLQNDPNGDSQRLMLNTEDDSVHLRTTNCEPGPFEGSTSIETLWQTADGQVFRERFGAL